MIRPSDDEINELAKRISESIYQCMDIRLSNDLVIDLIRMVIANDGRMKGDVLEREIENFVPRIAREVGHHDSDRSKVFWIGHACLGAVALGLAAYLL